MKTKSLLLATLLSLNLGASAQSLATYQSTVMGQGPISYFKLDGNPDPSGVLTNAVATNTAVLSLIGVSGLYSSWVSGFTYDIFNNPGKAIYISAAADSVKGSGGVIINGGAPTGTNNSTAEGTVSFLFRTLSNTNNTGRRYLFFAGGIAGATTNLDGTTNYANAFSAFFENTNVANGSPNALKLRFGGAGSTILDATNIVPNSWYYMAVTYTELGTVTNKATWYLGRPGGVLATGVTTNVPTDVAGDGVTFRLASSTNQTEGFRNPGNGEADEFASWNRRLSASEIQAQFANLPNLIPGSLSAYQGVVTGQTPSYYFKLDNNFVDAVSGTLTLKQRNTPTNNITFTTDWFGNAANAAVFTNVADVLTNNGNLLSGGGTASAGNTGSGKGTVSCLFRALAATNFSGQRFIYSTDGSTTVTNGFGLFFENLTSTSDPGSLKVRYGNTSKAILQWTNIVPGNWYYFAMNYDESLAASQVNWWLGQPGFALQTGVFTVTPGSLAGQGNTFFLGNNTNYNAAFRNGATDPGLIDEFAIWHRILGGSEITNQFNALLVSSGPPPTVYIALSGTNVVVAWPSSTDSGYALQSTTNLLSAWAGAGSPSVVGTNNVVTNAVTSSAMFYRLKK